VIERQPNEEPAITVRRSIRADAPAGGVVRIDLAAGELSQIRRGSVASGICTSTYRAGLDRDLSVTG